jgi:hypothetical protein
MSAYSIEDIARIVREAIHCSVAAVERLARENETLARENARLTRLTTEDDVPAFLRPQAS